MAHARSRRQPPAGQPMAADEDPRQAVARARAHVLSGRGPGADTSETDRYQRERPTLGPLPAPLERELVHLNTAAFRSGSAADLDETAMHNQRDRLRLLWGGPQAPVPAESRQRAGLAACTGFVAGATIGLMVARLARRRS